MKSDVLDLKAMDIADIDILDYSVTPVMTPDGRLSVQQEERSQLNVAWNADDFKWELLGAARVSSTGKCGPRNCSTTKNSTKHAWMR